MEAREEARSLKADTLPTLYAYPLTRVWELDGEIAKLQDQLSELQRQRQEALDYAINEQIAEDENCRLDVKAGRLMRILHPERFREVFPKEYEMCCEIERKDILDRLDHVGEKINLTIVDRLIKKPVLMGAQGVVTVTEGPKSYQVVRK